MDDALYLYKQDIASKKSIAVQARRTTGKVYGPRKCTLPHDHMTKKERNAMNGPVIKYDMARPCKFEEFKKWPTDLQRNYIKGLLDTYHVPVKLLSEMWGVSEVTTHRIKKVLGVRSDVKPHDTRFSVDAWERFLRGESNEPETVEQPETEETAVENAINPVEDDPFEKDYPDKPEVPAASEAPKKFYVNHFNTVLDINNWDDLFEMLKMYDISDGFRVHIGFDR